MFIFFLLISIVTVLPAANLRSEIVRPQRSVLIQEKITIKDLPHDKDSVRIWIPYPQSKEWQEIEGFQINSPVDTVFTTEPEYGNKVIYLDAESVKKDFTLSLSFIVKRKEYDNDKTILKKDLLKRFLKSDKTVPVNGGIKKLALDITKGKMGDMEKVKALYDYLINELTYSKDDPAVCGIGDSLVTLRHKKGICSDYHSLFISMVRSIGIPAKFEIGIPIPRNSNEGPINGYHCWAEFFIEGRGWIPVDISEADKHPDKKDYFFGHLDENRVHFTTGRDIRLNPEQEGEPLNFFVFPYVEIDGKPFDNIYTDIIFRDMT